MIIPDLPFEEAEHEDFQRLTRKYGLKFIQLVSPITPVERLREIGERAEGFVYCVAGFGTTGARQKFGADVEKYLANVRKYVKVPLALGFGIQERSEIVQAGALADIVVIGSKIIKMYDEKNDVREIVEFLK